MQEPGNKPGDTPPSGTPPDGNPGGAPGSQGTANISHTGATELTSDASTSDQSYSSESSAQNALLVSGATVNLTNPTISKTGDDEGDSADFYGTNAAVFAYDNATLNISGGTITTNGAHANAVFAYDSGTINISDTTITTSSNNSGGVMVTDGGTLTATNLTVTTSGNSSAPIRSDRGGGTLTVEGGNYTSNGVGSPAIYSTADITIKNAQLTANASEGVVIEGLNSVTLENTTVTDTNNQLNGNSETYKNIFIYQSMSGDAETGTGTFTAKNSTFTTNQGDHFFITNTTAVINLTSNKFTNNDTDGAFLRAQTGKWGNSGSNGGNVTLNATSQEIIGDIVIDSISSLAMNLTGSYFKGTISEGGTVGLTLDSNSIVVLTGDSYLTSLDNADSSNQNIYANGFKLYVADSEVSINQSEAPESFLASETAETTEETIIAENNTDMTMPIILGISGGIVILIAIVAIIVVAVRKKKKAPNTATPAQTPVSMQPNTDPAKNPEPFDGTVSPEQKPGPETPIQ